VRLALPRLSFGRGLLPDILIVGSSQAGEFATMTAYGFVPPVGAEPTIVTTDVPCRKCQYNLRSLPIDGRCPECGTPVGFSTKGDLIRYSDPTWTDTLRRGINCIILGVLVAVVGGILAAFLFRGNPIPMILSSFASSILFLVGAWLLTMPDPSGLGEDKYGTSRKLIRITLLVGLVNHLLTFAQQTMVMPPDARFLVQSLAGLASLVGVVGQFAMLNYLGKLARRIPDFKIADRAHFLMYALGITYGLFIVLGLIAALSLRGARTAGPPAGLVAVGCIAGLMALALIVFGVMYLFMLDKLGKRLKEQAALARQTWAAAPISPQALR
jgi:hypothetical protein